MIGLIEIFIIFFTLIFIFTQVVAFWKIFRKIGIEGFWGILAIIPGLNVFMIFYLAFSKWPIENKLKELQKD